MKIFNTLEEINSTYDVSVEVPSYHPVGMYALFEVVEPNHVEYFDWSSYIGVAILGEYDLGKNLVACLPKHSEFSKMEQYIKEYKHLIGCEMQFRPNGEILVFGENREVNYLFKSSPKYTLSLFDFYLDEDTLDTYEEYMELHYPQYKHVWEHQL